LGTGEGARVRRTALAGRPGRERQRGNPAGEPFSLKVLQQELVSVPAGTTGNPQTDVSVTFPITFTAPGEYVVQVKTEGDALDLDNVRSLVVTVRESVPVLLVNGKPAADRDDQATHHLGVALNPAVSPSPVVGPTSPF